MENSVQINVGHFEHPVQFSLGYAFSILACRLKVQCFPSHAAHNKAAQLDQRYRAAPTGLKRYVLKGIRYVHMFRNTHEHHDQNLVVEVMS